MENKPLPPFKSRLAADNILTEEFPEHGDALRVGGPALDALSQKILEKRSEYRKLGLELAGLETELRRKIGLFRGLRTRIGTWLWEKQEPQIRTDWISLMSELKIPKAAQAKFSRQVQCPRRLSFQRANDKFPLTQDQTEPENT